jgi:hypothetical protein
MMNGYRYICTTKKYRIAQDPFIYIFICLIILKWHYVIMLSRQANTAAPELHLLCHKRQEKTTKSFKQELPSITIANNSIRQV